MPSTAEIESPSQGFMWIADNWKVQPEDRILDCGSGYGFASSFFASHYGCSVLGVDIDNKQILHSARYYGEYCNFIKWDFNDPLTDEVKEFQSNKILFLETIGYSKYPHELADNCSRLLPDGGEVLIKTHYFDPVTLEEDMLALTRFYRYVFDTPEDLTKVFASRNMKCIFEEKFPFFDRLRREFQFRASLGYKINFNVNVIPYVAIFKKEK